MKFYNKPQSLIHFLIFFLFSMVLSAGQAFGAASSGYSEYFIPGYEDTMLFILDDVGAGSQAGNMHAVISVTAWAGNTTLYYDHWEDGYDFDPNHPVTTADETYTLANAGSVQTFEESNILLPRASHLFKPDGISRYHDGRDHIYVAGGAVTVVRISWTEAAGTLMVVGWEIYPVRPQLTTYINPFGEDLARDPSKNYWDFDRAYTLIQATTDTTTVQVDLDKDGTYDRLDWNRDGTLDGTSTILNRGEALLLDRVTMGDQAINGATVNASTADNLLIAGTRIEASDTIQLQYIIGDQGSNYEIRGFSAFPRGFWDNEYYAPVHSGAPANNGDSDIYLYNPNDTVLTINYQTGSGSGSFNVNPKTTLSFYQATGSYVPQTSGAYLKGNQVFWGVATVDTSDSDPADGGAGRTHEWGYNLVPSFLLDNEHFMGWAPGSYPVGTGGNADNSGVYVSSAAGNIRLFVDYNPTDATPFDVYYDLGHLDSQFIFDPNDGDMATADIYATGPFTGAFGQNPDLAPDAAPAIDTGYMLLPGSDFIDLVMRVHKSVDPAVLPTGPFPQQTTFTLEVDTGKYTVDNVRVIDLLPAGWEYLTGTTHITLPDGSTVTTNPTLSAPGNRTLTWGSGILGSMAPYQKLSISFDGRTTLDFSEGDISKNNVTAIGTRTVEGVIQTFTTTDFAFITYGSGDMDIAKTSDIATAAYPGDAVNYRATVTNSGATILNDISIYDQLPAGTTYVAGSAQVQRPVAYNVRDEFTTAAYTNNNGTVNWSAAWAETDTFGAAGAGAVWVTGGALQFRAAVGTNYWADNFSSVSYSRQDGNANWSTNWTEIGDDGVPNYGGTSDNIGIDANNRLEFWEGADSGDSIQRSAIVTGATNLRIQYSYDRANIDATGDNLVVDYYNGSSWITLETLNGGTTIGARGPFDITWTPTDTTITLRFRLTGALENNEEHRIDTVSITDTTPYAATGTLVSRAADIDGAVSATLSFGYTAANLDSGGTPDTIVAQASSDGVNFTTLETFTGTNGSGTRSYNLISPTNYASATTTVRFRVTSGFDASDEYFNVDNVDISYREIATVAAHDPTNFVLPEDNFDLDAGESLILTYQVTVNDPLETGITEITNTAFATCAEILVPISATVTDPVVNPNQSSVEVGDRVWLDSDGDGILDVGEPGIPNVEVTLKDQYGAPLQTMLTNSLGYYHFYDVAVDAGYYVEIIGGLPSGLTQTTDSRTDNRTDSFDLRIKLNYKDNFSTAAYNNSNGLTDWSAVSWIENEAVQNPAAGNIQILSGELRLTASNNIYRQMNLSSAASAIVTIPYRTSNNWEAGDTAYIEVASSPAGPWTNVLTRDDDGNGTVVFSIPSALLSATTTIRIRTNSVESADAEYFYVDYVNVEYTVSGSALTQYLDADLGYKPSTGTAIFGNLVWSDANSNGIRDAGEPGLSGVTVRLYSDANGNGSINTGETYVETTSGAGGAYLFTGVTASGTQDYIVWVDQSDLTAYDITTPPSGIFSYLNVAAGSSHYNADFGFVQHSSGTTYTITDRVWLDNGQGTGGAANDGSQNGTEGGIAGVTVVLLDGSLNVVATTTTDGSGNFTFSGVPAGVRYTWQVTDQAAILTSYYGTTPSALSGSYQMPGTLTGNLDYTAAPHFGYNVSRSLGDTVFNDNGAGGGTAGDGIQNGGEPGIRGVTVLLYRDVDSDNVFEPGGDDGASLGSLVTDASGKYLFSGLADGWYWVSTDNNQIALSGFNLTSTDNSVAAGHQQREQLSGGVSNFNADFGYRAPNPGSLSGTLWEDDDADGSIDSGETRLANVTVDLIRGGVVIATSVTDASGHYEFTGLVTSVAGIAYTVKVTDTNSTLDGYEAIYEKTGGTSGPFDGQENESLTSNENVGDINFGFFKPKPTLAVISYFKVFTQNGPVIAEWETVSQIGTLGFNLVRRDDSGDVVQVTNRPVPALIFPHGGVYRCLDATATAGGTYAYELQELEASGTTRMHGPYTVTVAMASDTADAALPDDLFRVGFSRTPREIYQPEKPVIDAGASDIKAFDDLFRAKQAQTLRDIYGTEDPAASSWIIISSDRVPVSAEPLTGIRDVKIRVTESGLYRVSAEAVATALNVVEADVIDVIAARQVRLSNQGMTVAYYPAEDNSGIYFYGEQISSIYTDYNVYWLKLMPGAEKGDLNGDGMINRADLAIGMDVMNGNPAEGLRADYAASDADVNGNGKVDMPELAYIRNTLAGVMGTSSGDMPAETGEDKFFTTTIHFEKDTFYKTDAPIKLEDFWFWDFYTLGNPEFGPLYGFDPFPMEAPDVATGDTHVAELTVYFHGFSNHTHQAQVILNAGTGKELNLGEVTWNGYDPVSKTFPFNQAKLNNGANTVKVSSLKTNDAFGVDSFDLTYQRAYTAAGDSLEFTAGGNDVITVSGFTGSDISLFDLTDPKSPKRVAGAAIDAAGNRITVMPEEADTPYLAVLLTAAKVPELLADTPSSLKDPSNSSDYLVITADELADGAQELADYRQSRGKIPMVVRLSDVFDEFSHGIYAPYAIRDFIAYALSEWDLPPQYVVLVGDGTFDFKENLELFSIDVRNLMPVVMTDTPYGIYASDTIYGDVDGDGLANVALGRIPAKTSGEVSNFVSKVIAYEGGVPGARSNVLMLADKPEGGVFNNFPADSDAVAALADGFTVDKVYYPGKTARQMRDAFVAGVAAGEWLVNYIGHGGYDVMSNFFNTTHTGLLVNGQYPIYVALTCLAGDYAYPWMDTLSEKMVMRTGGGMIASWSPTGLSINSEAVKMNKELFTTLFDEGVGTMGLAVNRALERYQSSGELRYPFMMDIYSLLGDPALEIR